MHFFLIWPLHCYSEAVAFFHHLWLSVDYQGWVRVNAALELRLMWRVKHGVRTLVRAIASPVLCDWPILPSPAYMWWHAVLWKRDVYFSCVNQNLFLLVNCGVRRCLKDTIRQILLPKSLVMLTGHATSSFLIGYVLSSSIGGRYSDLSTSCDGTQSE